MKRVRVAGVLLAAGLVLSACGQNTSSAGAASDADTSSTTASADTSGSQQTSSTIGQQAASAAKDESSVTSTAGGAISVDVSKDSGEELQPLEIVETCALISPSAAYQDTVYVEYCGKITNPNQDTAAEFPKLQITLENADGTILATDAHTGMYLMPGDTIVLGSQVAVPASQISDDTIVEYAVSASQTVAASSLDVPSSTDYEITNVSEQHTDWNTTVTGKITNNYTSTSSSVRLTALFKSGGEIVGMANSFIDNLPAGGTMAFEISAYNDLPDHDTVEVYAQYWGL